MTRNELVALFVGLILFILAFLPAPETSNRKILTICAGVIAFGIGLVLAWTGAK